MSDNESKDRKQKAVYWASSGTNSLGEPTHSDPIEVSVRIRKGISQSMDAKNNVIASHIQFGVDREIPAGSLLWIGELANLPDPVTSEGIFEIIDYSEVPDIKARKFDRHVDTKRHGGTPNTS